MWTVTVHVGQTRVCHYGKLCTVIKRLWSVWWEWRIYLVYCSHGWFPMLIHFHFNSRRQQFGIFLSPLHFFHPLSYYWSDTGHYLQEGGCPQQRAAKCRSGPTLRGFEHKFPIDMTQCWSLDRHRKSCASMFSSSLLVLKLAWQYSVLLAFFCNEKGKQ